jgi:hypothetical protein
MIEADARILPSPILTYGKPKCVDVGPQVRKEYLKALAVHISYETHIASGSAGPFQLV